MGKKGVEIALFRTILNKGVYRGIFVLAKNFLPFSEKTDTNRIFGSLKILIIKHLIACVSFFGVF